jgi:chromosome transmission fidelity protein 4
MVRANLTISHLIDGPISSETEYLLKQLEVALDKDLLQLVQGACKADNLPRALDAAKMMKNQATVEAAGKVAGFYHLPGLQERIGNVRVDKRKRIEPSRKTVSDRLDRASALPTPGPSRNGGVHDFAPRTGGRRSFGGVQRDSTPATRAETVIPETPTGDADSTLGYGENEMDDEPYTAQNGSPEGKRKRVEETPEILEEPTFAVPAARRRPDETLNTNGMLLDLLDIDKKLIKALILLGAAKNPFAKKAALGSNPFAKPAVAKPLNAIKSTSFFERVDNIESSGAPKGQPLLLVTETK